MCSHSELNFSSPILSFSLTLGFHCRAACDSSNYRRADRCRRAIDRIVGRQLIVCSLWKRIVLTVAVESALAVTWAAAAAAADCWLGQRTHFHCPVL